MASIALGTPRTASTPVASDATAPSRVALLSILGFWAFYFLLNTFKMSLGDETDQLYFAQRRAIVSVAGMGLTAILWMILRAVEHGSTRRLVATVFLAAIPITYAYASINYAAFYVVAPPESVLQDIATAHAKYRSPFHMILGTAVGWYFFIVAWGVLYIALAYAAKVQHAERRAAEFRALAQTAQLRALRYQVNPHFLFNTLNVLSSLVLRQQNDEAEAMIMNLSTFFRTSLAADPEEDVSLADEIQLQQLYLEIERVRFPERLAVTIDVAPGLERAKVPGLILQPLVENAIKYGVSRSTRPVTVLIRAHANDGRLHLVVEDDGEGGEGATPGHGVGLRNVCNRLEARFGDHAGCLRGPRAGGGFRVELILPLAHD
jgi:two-component sensor histidine kinase